MASNRVILFTALAQAIVAIGSMVDLVHVEGDHVSLLVVAPHPTWKFVHRGGEEGAWRRAHPGAAEPWWINGRYLVLAEYD